MKLPTATYRLQFREGMDFDRAAALVPYLQKLGISHLYASPIYQATSGSTHGYDVVDHNVFDPALGGREGFERMHTALKQAGMGLILDIVPNHMAASLENPWWRDVLRWGEQSRYARHFDIDWSQKLTLPVLGSPIEEVIAAGELAIVPDAEDGSPALAYFDNHFPLHPESPPFDSDADNLREILSAQPWELTYWKEASKRLSYRRFFEVTGLVGVRVEDEPVFNDVHRLTLELVRDGKVDGLRIDHVDGLADPGGYLARLREAVGDDTYIIVEKILVGDELLPSEWPIEGTSGYEFIDMIADVLPSDAGLEKLSQLYETRTGSADTLSIRREAKRQILENNFAGEVDRLVGLLSRAVEPNPDIKEALLALLAAMPVYRTYGAGGAMPERDGRVLEAAAVEAMQYLPDGHDTLQELVSFFKGEAPIRDEEAARLARIRFEQLSGPAMAKGVEDTLFYRDHRFLALNEVGCDPAHPAGNVERFHRRMEERAARLDHSLSGTSTHDTKRGEDARARLYAISEAPELWAEGLERWKSMNRFPDVLEPELEWLVYQALAGVWPYPFNEAALPPLHDRLEAYLQKALREAKQRTSWTEVDEAYEEAVITFVDGALENAAFREDFSRTLQPFIMAAHNNSLTQTLLKMACPGIPDIYQGSEAEDLSLVDPDNRRPPDFAKLEEMLQGGGESLPARKQAMIARLANARTQHPALFNNGDYQPLEVTGPFAKHMIAFSRSRGDRHLIVIAPRLTLGLIEETGHIRPDVMQQTEITLPEALQGKPFTNRLAGSEDAQITSGSRLNLGRFATAPWVALVH